MHTHTHKHTQREAVTEAICHLEAAVQLGPDSDSVCSWRKTCRHTLHLCSNKLKSVRLHNQDDFPFVLLRFVRGSVKLHAVTEKQATVFYFVCNQEACLRQVVFVLSLSLFIKRGMKGDKTTVVAM